MKITLGLLWRARAGPLSIKTVSSAADKSDIISCSQRVGLEADFQGSTASGAGNYLSGSRSSASITNHGAYSGAETRSAGGLGSVSAGLDWLGTVRGRGGYLVTPELLVYGTGGFAYGGVRASSNNALQLSARYTENFANVCIDTAVGPGPYSCGPGAFRSIGGTGSYTGTQVGWAAGGGFEWLFHESWSLKAEAIYYDLGTATLNSSPVAAFDNAASPWLGQPNALLVANAPSTRIRFDGVIARAGINYHFDWGSRPTLF